MGVNLYEYQKASIDKLKTGSILCGGVGSGKSITSLAYYFKECGGSLDILEAGEELPVLSAPRDLYIITTARKRDTLEWDSELLNFYLSRKPEFSLQNINVVVDSWNNIGKYCNVCGAFFIFDEQRVVGSGAWVKAFLQITKKNKWILLSATPGDTWMDYIPVFVANGFYKNRTQFLREHVVYNLYAKYPKVERYINCQKLINLRDSVLVTMEYVRPTTMHHKTIAVGYDAGPYEYASQKRWNIYEDKPMRDAADYCAVLRKITNTSPARIRKTREIINENPKLIIFYNFDYELDILRELCSSLGIAYAEWNGHKHMPIPKGPTWVYLVQYAAGAEGWNCIETNTILFYSASYSYKMMAQASGRIDRLNTPFQDLYCYHLVSGSSIDMAIGRCLDKKENFNESAFAA